MAVEPPLKGHGEWMSHLGRVYTHRVRSDTFSEPRTFNPIVFGLVIQTQVEGFFYFFKILLFGLCLQFQRGFPLLKTPKDIQQVMRIFNITAGYSSKCSTYL